MALAFLLLLAIIGMVLLWFVDPEKAILEAKEYLQDEVRVLCYARERYNNLMVMLEIAALFLADLKNH